jgi:hypothetical protein
MGKLKLWLWVVSAVALGLVGTSYATTLSSDVGYSYIHGYLEISNPSITAVGSGSFSGNAATVAPGSSVTMTGNWSIVDSDNSSCPFCVIQQYVGWIPPAFANGATPINLGLWSGIDPPSPSSGTFAWTTNAPTVLGTYFVGGTSTLDFQFDPVPGGTGFEISNPNIVDVASFEIDVPSLCACCACDFGGGDIECGPSDTNCAECINLGGVPAQDCSICGDVQQCNGQTLCNDNPGGCTAPIPTPTPTSTPTPTPTPTPTFIPLGDQCTTSEMCASGGVCRNGKCETPAPAASGSGLVVLMVLLAGVGIYFVRRRVTTDHTP